ncbi:hypothetical protein C8T65DRAFT_714348 [Cerioporus squamosus]|nr:hypothetical protein C8T65DRAFT_714348 [Cerioporus squamosus]
MDETMGTDTSSNRGLEMFRRHPIYDNIFSYLTPLSLTRMASVNRAIRTVSKDFAARAYNRPAHLLLAQGSYHMVISGSFALQFFDWMYYPDSDLDLYLHPDCNIIDVGQYLEQEGYKFVPRSWQLPVYKDKAEHICANIDVEVDDIEDKTEASVLYSFRSLRTMYTFERTLEGGKMRVAQLIVSRVLPLASILYFHSTCVMNIITYNAAYSLYPYATFERRDTLLVNLESQTQDALAKYSARGWRVLANPSPLNEWLIRPEPHNPLYSPWFFINTACWVCDNKSWVIQLDMDGVMPLPLPSASSQDPGWDPVAECGWQLYLVKWSSEVKLAFDIINSTIFCWRYTAPSVEYIESLFPFLRSQGRMEHAKIPKGKTREDIADAWTWWVLRLSLGEL